VTPLETRQLRNKRGCFFYTLSATGMQIYGKISILACTLKINVDCLNSAFLRINFFIRKCFVPLGEFCHGR
jgi:hypothetical protein